MVYIEIDKFLSLAAVTRVIAEPGDNFGEQVKKYKLFSRKEKQKWAIRGKKIKAKRNNGKRPSLI
jgi:hypothetical protein